MRTNRNSRIFRSNKMISKKETNGAMCTKKHTHTCETHGTSAWHEHMARAHGTSTWHERMAQAHGTGAWLLSLATLAGVST